MNLSAHHRDCHLKDNEINVGDIVWFHAYRRNCPIQGKVTKKGSMVELQCGWNDDDERIFYAIETLTDGEEKPFEFTKTTCPSIFKEKPPQLELYTVFIDSPDGTRRKPLDIMAWDMEQAEGIAETLDFNDYRDSEIVDVIDAIENYVE